MEFSGVAARPVERMWRMFTPFSTAPATGSFDTCSWKESGAPFVPNLLADVVLGHEFCAEILDFGPNTTKRLPAGSRVVSIPILFRGARLQAVGGGEVDPLGVDGDPECGELRARRVESGVLRGDDQVVSVLGELLGKFSSDAA